MKKILSIIGALAIVLTGFGYVNAQQTQNPWIQIIDSSPNYLQTAYDPESPTDRLPLGDPLDPLPALYVSVLDALTANISALVSGDLTIQDVTPSIFFKDTDATDGDINASINVNCTDCGSGTEDVDLDFSTQDGGVLTSKMTIDADSGILLKDDIKVQNNSQIWLEDSITGGYSYLGTIPSRGGGQYRLDQGTYTFTGDSDGNGNNCHTLASGSSFSQDFDCDTHHPNPYYRIMSNTPPDSDNQQFLAFHHDQTDGNIDTLTGDLKLNPIGLHVVVDGSVVESASPSQALLAGSTITKTHGTMRVEGSGGFVVLTSTPNIADGTIDNECIRIEGRNSPNTVTLQDESNLAGSGLELAGNLNFALGIGDQWTGCYNLADDKWYEKSRSDN